MQKVNETVSKGSGVISENERLEKEVIQLLLIADPRFGEFQLSYRPFPGAELRGYIESRKLIFEYEGHVFEWYSVDGPILPDGKWALYVRHRDQASFPSSGGKYVGARDWRLQQQ